MIDFNLVDRYFLTNIKVGDETKYIYQDTSAPGLKSNKVTWHRVPNLELSTFYTHEDIVIGQRINNEPKYGWLLESQAVLPAVYHTIMTNYPSDINLLFTHSSYLLNKYNNTRWIPGGSIWVGSQYGGGEIKIYPKTKLCSMVSSDKRMCQLHNSRIAIAELLHAVKVKGIDFYGTLFGSWTSIINTLQDYMFSIVVENFIDEEYFTEKLLNCFATGTIPIYMGAKNIGKHFNLDGIVQFDKPGQLLDLLVEVVNQDYYNKRSLAILDNFERCQKFRLVDDYIVTNYFGG